MIHGNTEQVIALHARNLNRGRREVDRGASTDERERRTTEGHKGSQSVVKSREEIHRRDLSSSADSAAFSTVSMGTNNKVAIFFRRCYRLCGHSCWTGLHVGLYECQGPNDVINDRPLHEDAWCLCLAAMPEAASKARQPCSTSCRASRAHAWRASAC